MNCFKIYNLVLLVNVLFGGWAFSEKPQSIKEKTIEVNNFEQIKQYLNEDSVLILSIDNVLLSSDIQMGQRSWFYHRLNKYQKEGCSKVAAAQKAIAEWTAVINAFPQKLVEENIPKVIEDIQNKRVKILGITGRGVGLASTTVERLKNLGVDLSKTSGTTKDFPIMVGEKLVLYRGGIVFTSGSNKLLTLKKLAELSQISKPKNIVMVSNSQSTLQQVGEGIRFFDENINFIPIRYAAMDDRVKNFKADIGDIQYELLSKPISDQEAMKLLAKKENSKSGLVGWFDKTKNMILKLTKSN